MRKLLNNKLVQEYDEAVDLSIHTKCPSKWMLIDLETGQMYNGMHTPDEYGKWKRLDYKVGDKMESILLNEKCLHCEDEGIYWDWIGSSRVSLCKKHFKFEASS